MRDVAGVVSVTSFFTDVPYASPPPRQKKPRFNQKIFLLHLPIEHTNISIIIPLLPGYSQWSSLAPSPSSRALHPRCCQREQPYRSSGEPWAGFERSQPPHVCRLFAISIWMIMILTRRNDSPKFCSSCTM